MTRQYIEIQILLMMFQLGFLTNAVVRRVTTSPMPSDTICPIVIFILCSFSLIVLFTMRKQLIRPCGEKEDTARVLACCGSDNECKSSS